MPDASVGTWSLYTTLLAVVMVLISLVLMVMLLVLAMLGRFRRSRAEADAAAPPPEPVADDDDAPPGADPGQMTFFDDPDGLYDGFAPEPAAGTPPVAKAAEAGAKALAAGFSARQKSPGTGLWQLVAALLACVPALMSAAWVDDIYGRLVTFTAGAGLNLALFAAQLWLIIWAARLQGRR